MEEGRNISIHTLKAKAFMKRKRSKEGQNKETRDTGRRGMEWRGKGRREGEKAVLEEREGCQRKRGGTVIFFKLYTSLLLVSFW